MSPAWAWVLLILAMVLVGCAFTFGVFRILRRTSDAAELGGKPKRKVLVTIKVRGGVHCGTAVRARESIRARLRCLCR